MQCYVCDRRGNVRSMARIGPDNDKRQIAIFRRGNNDLPIMEIEEETRVCFPCNQSISNELVILQADPNCLRLNIINQRHNRACPLCHAENDTIRISSDCRVHIFVQGNIYVPDNVRFCRHHLNQKGLIITELIPGLRFTNRPYTIPGTELRVFLEKLRNLALERPMLDEAFETLSEVDFSYLFPLNKQQFEELFTYCDPVPEQQVLRYVSRKDLMAYLCKMRQGLPDDLLKILFKYSSRQAVSMAVSTVRKSLTSRFVPENIGISAISRQEFIDAHVTPFANELYNAQPNIPRAIVIIDATYAYIHKSSHFRVLRQSYSMHKNRHLLKPTLIVGTDGYILAILGPYFSDSRNNDAAILREEFIKDGENLANWFRDGDIVLVDRGYRDVTALLQELGITYKMPALLNRGQRQLTSEQANDSRLVTKNRWLVEARNGHFRTMFKYFDHVFNIQNAKNVGVDYRITGAIINRYHPLIHMQGATVEVASKMLQRAKEANVVQARVQVDNLINRRAVWQRIDEAQILDFPRLDIDYLRDLTVGVYQVNLAKSYIQDKLHRDENEELQIDTLLNENNFMRIRVYSRFRNVTKHQVFIAYNNDGEDQADDIISGYYCTCQSGARTLGTCAHIASILWYLGYARHQRNVHYPDGSLLNTTMDAAHRADQEDNNIVEVID